MLMLLLLLNFGQSRALLVCCLRVCRIFFIMQTCCTKYIKFFQLAVIGLGIVSMTITITTSTKLMLTLMRSIIVISFAITFVITVTFCLIYTFVILLSDWWPHQ